MILNNIHDDYAWFQEDEVGYMTELHQREAAYEKAFAEYMGTEFEKEPLPLREDLENEAKHLSGQLAGYDVKLILNKEEIDASSLG